MPMLTLLMTSAKTQVPGHGARLMGHALASKQGRPSATRVSRSKPVSGIMSGALSREDSHELYERRSIRTAGGGSTSPRG